MVKTAMERYAVAGWGGPVIQNGKKVTSEAQAFLENLPVARLLTAIEAVEQGCDLLGLDARGKSKNRSYIKKFLEYCEQKQWLLHASATEAPSDKNSKKLYTYRNKNGKRRIYHVSTSGAKLSPTTSLGTQPQDYCIVSSICFSMMCLATKCASQVPGTIDLFVFEHQLINQFLWKNLELFSQSIEHLACAEGVVQKVVQMLGYLHRIQGVDINQLSLTSLIPFVKIYYTENDVENNLPTDSQGSRCSPSLEQIEKELSLQQDIAQRRIKHAAKTLIDWINVYLGWLDQCRTNAGAKDGLANSTKQQFIYALIKVAEYIYKKETTQNFKDIEIIHKLKEKSADLAPDRKRQKARVADRCLSWEKAVQVVELQREKADTRLYEVLQNRKPELRQRTPASVASEIQKVIILLLMVLIPSDRQQTYRRLQFREALKLDAQVEGVFLLWGDMIGDVLTPKSKLKSPDQARWWLAIYDFKTVEHYEPFWYPLPNQIFSDGKTFYEYLEMWFFGLDDLQGRWTEYYEGEQARWQGFISEDGRKEGWREALYPGHDFAFSMPRTKRPFDKISFKDLVQDVFIQFSPQVDAGRITPVTPHSFRTMLATYTDGILTNAEELSMAYCEHHSVAIRRGTYTFTDNLRQIADAQRVMETINETVFLGHIQTKQKIDIEAAAANSKQATELPVHFFPKSVWEGIEHYGLNCDKNRFSMVRTAVERFAVPGWGGPISQAGQKVDPTAQEFLKSLPVYKVRSVLDAVDKGCTLLSVSKRGRSRNRSYAKRFLEFCKTQGWLNEPRITTTPPTKNQPGGYRFSQANHRRDWNFSLTGAGKIAAYKLGTVAGDYINVEGHQILGNLELQQEIDEFTRYVKHQARQPELLIKVSQMLGYLHRIQGVELAELRLNHLIPFVKLHYTEQDFADDPIFALDSSGKLKYPDRVESRLASVEGRAQRHILQKALEVLNWIDEYFKWLDRERKAVGEPNGYANGTKRLYIDALIKVTEYVYCSQTFSKTFSDITIIEKLREKQAEFPISRKQQKARVGARCLTWEEAVEVVEKQREKADQRYILSFPHWHNGKFYPNKRHATGIAHSIQVALILLLMTLIPTDRQQTYRRLQFIETLKVDEKVDGVFLLHGDFVHGELIPKSKLENSEQARWWLAVYEFKTDEKYGSFWYPIPNQQFMDGKTLYEYLEMWFFGLEDLEGKWAQYYSDKHATWQGYIDENGRRCGWRDALAPEHSYAFTGPRSRQPFSRGGITQMIQSVFIRFTPELDRGTVVPVTPQSFRTMLATYTYGKLTESEEKSMAYCEHHSVTIRRRAYTLSNNEKKIAGAIKVMDRINNNLFLKRSES
ncbi:hypothetical protein [Leptolyngbya sp. ST-U4]|uniref:hypothetical protein n=1 Tax=Leptolyngbya sp. ST-U4 TaxID=2933912 RepID=UPI003298A2C1